MTVAASLDPSSDPIIFWTVFVGVALLGVGIIGVIIGAVTRSHSVPGPPQSVDSARERRLTMSGSIGSALVTGSVIAIALALMQVVVSRNDQAAQRRLEQQQRISDARQSLLLALNLGPDLRGLDATSLDEQVQKAISSPNSTSIGDVLPGGPASERVTCGLKNRPLQKESKVLPGVRLAGKTLDHANFSGMVLRYLNFNHASLRYALFCDTILDHVNFGGADLTDANFHRATVYGGDLTFAKMPWALVDSVSWEWPDVNAETCWSVRVTPDALQRYSRGLRLLPIRNPFAPVSEARAGHTCVNREAEDFRDGRREFFAVR